MVYGYCRCSTNETKQDIDRQIRELKEMGATPKTIFKEYESGTKVNRPEYLKMLDIIKDGDTIVTTEVSRLTRSTKQLCDLIDLCKEKKLKLIIKGSVTIDCTNGQLDPMTNAFLQMAGVFSELERNMIVNRVRSGLQNAKAKGKKLGRPSLTINDIPQVVIKHFDAFMDGAFTKTEYARLCGISRPTLNKYISVMTDK